MTSTIASPPIKHQKGNLLLLASFKDKLKAYLDAPIAFFSQNAVMFSTRLLN